MSIKGLTSARSSASSGTLPEIHMQVVHSVGLPQTGKFAPSAAVRPQAVSVPSKFDVD